MSRPTSLLRTLAMIGLAAVLGWSLLSFAGSMAAYAQTEPTPRPSPTPGAYITVATGEAVGQQDVGITVSGFFWTGSTGLRLYWDQGDGGHLLAGPFGVNATGQFQVNVQVPAAWATPGGHSIFASDDQGRSSAANVLLLAPTPTNTPTPSITPSPTNTPPPPDTPTPVTPTPTFTPTPTPTPSPTLLPITPIVTASPLPPPPATNPTREPYPTLIPTHMPTAIPASPTPTSTPILIEVSTATATFVPIPAGITTSTPTFTPTAAPTQTPTATPTHTPTATSTPTRAIETGNALGSSVPPTGLSVSPDVTIGMPEAGTDWKATFLTGFVVAILFIVLLVAFLTVVLATVLFAWQFYHKRQLAQQR